ncbi:MAG: hypothetical protein MUC35_02715 [Candidatus Margulisbacteria bacterium]|nr:hypothetical protein [Candidatus Margulisiibacteriota bacterium]
MLAVLAAPSRIENGPELFLRLVPHALDIPPGQWKEVELPQLIYRLTENCWGWNRTPWASCHKTQEYIAALPRKALLSLAWYLKDVAAKQNGQAGDLEQSRAWLPTDKAIELLKENQAIRIMGLQLKDRTYYRHGLIWEGTKLAELLLLNYIPSTELFHVSGTFDYAFSGTLKQFQPGDVHWVLLTKGRDPLVDDTPDPQIEPPVSLAG